ncbi:MAG: DUF427 domain-containing protein [Polyangiaceae bacterium]|nr:DUF427 domain-containing protein [Polyangiaceae bacterium]
MVKAKWNGAVIAESTSTRVVEGNHYFPADSVDRRHLAPSEHHTTCFWKGVASYYHVVVDGQTNQNAAWYYPDTKPKAKPIEGYIAFWRGVEISE